MATVRDNNFAVLFEALTGHAPFPWQEDLYRRLLGGRDSFPRQCSIPTGLGKTAVIAVWLIALAEQSDVVPRRLAYIVNRRTVVDQSTTETVKIRDRLMAADCSDVLKQLRERLESLAGDSRDGPLAISTLRGQFADKGEWSADPARPAVVVGTVDMIGSRLLFSGYGCGRAKKPHHAGLLGQNTLLVHDEAHLEPAFQTLLTGIAGEQKRYGDRWPIHVMELTATSRNVPLATDKKTSSDTLVLSDKDRKHKVVSQRLNAAKRLLLHSIDDEKAVAETIAERAIDLAKRCPNSAILVFVRRIDDVSKVAEKLKKSKDLRIPEAQIEQLTGTMRGLERDRMATKSAVFARFLPNPKAEPRSGTVFLICTSAGEVGVDISADHMVCDLTPFDSMAQRFGRVNRFGNCDNTEIHVVHPEDFDDASDYEARRKRTYQLLKDLGGDASPAAIDRLDAAARADAFTPTPTILSTTDILFDAWALTTIRTKLPGRPPVAPYLHGITSWEPPETHVAWREEVAVITDWLRDIYNPGQLLDDYPLKPHELLRDNTDRVLKRLQVLSQKHGESPVWIVDDDNTVRVAKLNEIADKDKKADLEDKTVLLPPSVGGLRGGLLDSDSDFADDVADHWYLDADRSQRRRIRVWDGDAAGIATADKMRLVRIIDTQPDDADADDADVAGHRFWRWYELPDVSDSEDTRNARRAVAWKVHTKDVVRNIEGYIEHLSIADYLKKALVASAAFHDLGKIRAVFQRILGNTAYNAAKPETAWAKSGSNGRKFDLPEHYRHEFGSLLEIEDNSVFRELDDDTKELVHHLIATHHGRARPHFPPDEAFDPESPKHLWNDESQAVPQRFARLQRKYGRWGLAYLESLLRAADWAASAKPSEFVEKEQEDQA